MVPQAQAQLQLPYRLARLAVVCPPLLPTPQS
eukprot:COSAG01_NODE_60139_length_296_cov_0.791878_1_plen_31_part_01